MRQDTKPGLDPQEEFVSVCGGIQPDPILPPPEESSPVSAPALEGNGQIEAAIRQFHRQQTPDSFMAVCLAIRAQIIRGGQFIFPADITEDDGGNTVYSFKTLDLEDGPALVAFTGWEEKEKAPPSAAVSHFIDAVLEPLTQTEEIRGLMVNPWGEAIYLGKEDIAMILTPGSERFL